MFHLHDRRVRSLRLTATGDDHLWTGRILLQDALHTASLPGLSGNRLTLIKQFTIGRFSTRQSSSSLSALIDHQLLDLSSRAVPADHPNAASSPIVYFRDEVEPYVMLAVRLAANADTSAWFWPLAVSSWQPTMPRSEGLRVMLFQLSGTRAGLVSVVSLVSELRRRDLLQPLLAVLEKDDATHLLQLTCGGALSDHWPSQDLRPDTVAVEISSTARRVLWQACKRWGGVDVRAIWLATILLVEEKPARLLDPLLIQRARALVDFISDPPGRSKDKSSAAQVSSQIIGNEQADDSPQSRFATGVDSLAGDHVAESIDQTSHVHTPSSSHYFRDTTQAPASLLDPIPVNSRAAVSMTPSSQKIVSAAANPGLENELFGPEDGSIAADVQGQALALNEPAVDSFARQSLKAPVLDSASRSSNQIRVDAGDPREASVIAKEHEDLLWPPRERDGVRNDPVVSTSLIETSAAGAAIEGPQAQVKLPWTTTPQWTDYGGFCFLLALMGRLRFEEFLENHPHLIELDFPPRLLLFAANQLAIPAADPVRVWLQDVNDLPAQEIEFSAPPIWREQVYRSSTLVLSPILGRPGCHMMTGGSERNVLASWRGEMPESAKKLVADSQTRVVPARQSQDDLNQLTAGWYRAMRRWCRAYAGLRLRELIQRSGRIGITRTHVDLFFALNSVDIRIRRAGLDVDLGWLPWLGRVVSFHYLDKEEFDGRE